jgi:hypothetical protein
MKYLPRRRSLYPAQEDTQQAKSENEYCNIVLKVVGNEKLEGLKFLQLLGIGLGQWRSMSIFILNVPFAIEKNVFPFPLSPAK